MSCKISDWKPKIPSLFLFVCLFKTNQIGQETYNKIKSTIFLEKKEKVRQNGFVFICCASRGDAQAQTWLKPGPVPIGGPQDVGYFVKLGEGNEK